MKEPNKTDLSLDDYYFVYLSCKDGKVLEIAVDSRLEEYYPNLFQIKSENNS